MNRIEALWKWLGGKPKSVTDATFEELFSSEYSNETAYPELLRRLKPIVKAMAGIDNSDTSEQVTNAIFAEFTHLFPGFPPEAGLLRLAWVIRNRIGPEAFYARGQARNYYAQLAVYHLDDPRLRACLEFTFHNGMNRRPDRNFARELATVLQVSPEKAIELSQQAWHALCAVTNEKFNTEQWKGWTEGNLPWPCPEGDRA